MKPHMAFIQNTLIKKHLAEKAGEKIKTYERYRALANKALAKGHTPDEIIIELTREMEGIEQDFRDGDELFQRGFRNAKLSCVEAIKRVLGELKGENNGQLHSDN